MPLSHAEDRIAERTSQSLLLRLRDRDADAWARCVRLYAPLVARWCRGKRLAGSDLDDVTQDVFVSVYKGIDQYKLDGVNGTFRGWLHRIAQRRIADWYAARADRDQPRGGTEALRHLHEIETPTDAAELRAETLWLYQSAMALIRDEFSPRDWEVFRRMTADGQPAPAVAAEFGLSSAAARQVKSRILRRIKQTLGDASGGSESAR